MNDRMLLIAFSWLLALIIMRFDRLRMLSLPRKIVAASVIEGNIAKHDPL